MILGGAPRVPVSLPLLSILATDPAAETVVEVGGVRYVGRRYGQGAAE